MVTLCNTELNLPVVVSAVGDYNELSTGAELDVTWKLTLPADLVPGSERARVEVVGDLLGPSIDVRTLAAAALSPRVGAISFG